MRKGHLLVPLALTSGWFDLACKREEKFPALGSSIASPVDVAAADDGTHFFVLNSDFDRTYNRGSVVVMDRDGNKVTAIEVPRLGRSLTASGNDLLVTIDAQDDKNKTPHALLFDVTDATHPVLKKDFPLECSPINAVMRKAYAHFAVACADGGLYIGTLAEDRTNSQLKRVRHWGVSRRALYLDPKREVLLGFTTELGKQRVGDAELADNRTYRSNLTFDENIPNEIPDVMEESRRAQSNLGQRQLFQYFIYDLAKERAPEDCTVTETENCVFPFRASTDVKALQELHFIYFRLANFDGTPDKSPEAIKSEAYKYRFYRTNFYQAKPDPEDEDVFYLSQRGSPDVSAFANQIVKVTINDTSKDSLRQPGLKTGDAFQFERVYGFKGAESSKFVYPGDFAVARIGSQKTIVVNNFRDLVTWVDKDRYFSLGAQTLDDSEPWFAELVGGLAKDDIRTYYQVALLPDGRGLSCSFYGNRVVLFDLTPGVGFQNVKAID